MRFPLNHIGLVVPDIERYLSRRLSGEIICDIVDDTQEARIILLEHGLQHPLTELIQPLSETATTAGFLKRNGGGYHHLCYSAESVTQVLEYFTQAGIKRIYGPVTAPALDDQEVLFGYTRNREIIEFVVKHV